MYTTVIAPATVVLRRARKRSRSGDGTSIRYPADTASAVTQGTDVDQTQPDLTPHCMRGAEARPPHRAAASQPLSMARTSMVRHGLDDGSDVTFGSLVEKRSSRSRATAVRLKKPVRSSRTQRERRLWKHFLQWLEEWLGFVRNARLSCIITIVTAPAWPGNQGSSSVLVSCLDGVKALTRVMTVAHEPHHESWQQPCSARRSLRAGAFSARTMPTTILCRDPPPSR